jgi:DNA ligase-1
VKRFAAVLDCLTTTPQRNGKIALVADYFRSAPDPDRGYALGALTDGLFRSLPIRRAVLDLMAQKIDPVLYQLSRDYVGDTAETVALLWPDPAPGAVAPSLAEVVSAVEEGGREGFAQVLSDLLDRLDVRGRWALLKVLGGAPRVGVSARLAKTALAEMSGHNVAEVEEIWHALKPPYVELFRWLEGNGERPQADTSLVFRPLMLSNPIEDADHAGLVPQEIAAEWKWDGVRVQIAANGHDARVFSRSGDDISGAFPEIVAAFRSFNAVLDGELLVVRGTTTAPFNDLQQRLNRKSVTPKMLKDHPAFVRLYDILFEEDEDLRPLSFSDRRSRLEAWFTRKKPMLAAVSDLIEFSSLTELEAIWSGTRDAGIEGLMLKRKTSPYLAGRAKGHWWKWKRSALTLDCVLMYAQRGSGKRSSYYSDYTFGVWREGQEGPELVPVGKAYSGFTDEELHELDKFVRNNTIEAFGPVRAVEPKLVMEVAFDAVFPSARHKSGVAMRFPRIHRIRWDKPAAEADTLEAVKKMIVAPATTEAQAAAGDQREQKLAL